jgi:hypothetical protein
LKRKKKAKKNSIAKKKKKKKKKKVAHLNCSYQQSRSWGKIPVLVIEALHGIKPFISHHNVFSPGHATCIGSSFIKTKTFEAS